MEAQVSFVLAGVPAGPALGSMGKGTVLAGAAAEVGEEARPAVVSEECPW